MFSRGDAAALADMVAQSGRELVAAKYQWETVARAMAAVYETLVERQGAVAG